MIAIEKENIGVWIAEMILRLIVVHNRNFRFWKYLIFVLVLTHVVFVVCWVCTKWN